MLAPVAPVARNDAAALRADASDVLRYLDTSGPGAGGPSR
jgi:hypothetical protein